MGHLSVLIRVCLKLESIRMPLCVERRQYCILYCKKRAVVHQHTNYKQVERYPQAFNSSAFSLYRYRERSDIPEAYLPIASNEIR